MNALVGNSVQRCALSGFYVSSPVRTTHLSVFPSQDSCASYKSSDFKSLTRSISLSLCISRPTFTSCQKIAGTHKTHKQSDDDEEQDNFDSMVEEFIAGIKWDEKGLVVAIAQHVETGAILMQGFANKEAIAATLSSRKATFYSRSRSCLWTKGETSSNYINVIDVFLDCDHDSVIYLGKPDGPTCHTGEETCYFTAASDFLNIPKVDKKRFPLTVLYALESTIEQRKKEPVNGLDGKPSWTRKLLNDEKLICCKIREEADELCKTLEDDEEKERAASEMADVLYHAMVLLAIKNVKMEEVLEILRKRFGQSGIEEKNSRRK